VRSIPVAALLAPLLALVLLGAATVLAGPDGEGGGPTVVADAGAPPPEVADLALRAQRVRDLIAGVLDVTIEPAALFWVALDDPAAVAIESHRLRAVVAAARPDAGVDAGSEPTDGGVNDAGLGEPGAGIDPLAGVDPRLYEARVALDEAVLAFLSKPPAGRRRLLDLHAERQAETTEAAKAQREAARKKQEAEAARDRALEAAKQARSEALRRVENEKAQLRSVELQHAELSQQLLLREESLPKRLDALLEWDGEVRRAHEGFAAATLSRAEIDSLYDRIDHALAESRAETARVLDSYAAHRTSVTPVGPDPRADLPADVDTSEVDALRERLRADEAALTARQLELRGRAVGVVIRELRELNRMRLELLPHLSDAKRSRVLGFEEGGRSQARRELRLVGTVLRYHMLVTLHWVDDLRTADHDDAARVNFYWNAAKVLLAFLIYGWWYRRADAVLASWRARERELTLRQPRRPHYSAFIRFVARIRRPLEWLIVFQIILRLLPERAADLEEIQLVKIALWWTLGERLVVSTLNALLMRRTRLYQESEATSRLRLRSLRFVGGVVVAFGLTLSLTAELIGRGTIYQWVTIACWIAVVPVLMLVVRGYRTIIFDRVARLRQSALPGWIVRHREGVLVAPAALAGAVILLQHDTVRALRSYIARFEIIRRILAYWFRRELAKKDERAMDKHVLSPLPEGMANAFDPEREAKEIVPSVADPQLDEVIAVVEAPGGGVFAVVGERGRGKSTLLRRIQARCKAHIVACPDNVEDFLVALRDILGLPADASYDAIREAVAQSDDDTAILVDDAHHLMRPVIGGLDGFETILALARESSAHACTWVFAVEGVIWQFFERARGSRPLFDDVISLRPWSEEGIGRLLRHRSKHEGIAPRFDLVVTDLLDDADELERAEAFERAELSYYRLLWDYAAGNPGVALHFWQRSLAVDEEGAVWVRLFVPPSTGDIETLSDDAVFVLRAVVQLDLATFHDVVSATMLPVGGVRDALRYARARGYVEVLGQRHRVSWQWFRAITGVLQRRHLLVER
jgi:hypothetical protein